MNARGFDLAQLRTFIAVTEAGSVSAGAQRVFLSQSSVSEQLKKLEERVGQPLFIRSKQGMSATPAGAKLLDHARRIVALCDAAFDDMLGRTLDGEVRIAITDYYRPHDVAEIIRRFANQHPRLRLHVTVLPSAVIDSSAGDNAYDIGLSLRLTEEGRGTHKSTSIRREKLMWVGATQMLRERPALTPPWPLVLLPATCQLQRRVVRMLDEARMPYLISHSASGVAGLQLALRAGLGISCLNESSIGEGLMPCPASFGLPALPAAEFHLLPGRPGESAHVTNARAALAELLV
ncbi:LysR family transcriptional regulator [Paraburkholderia silvatlantica]|uniref:DNA-binding transcriptional LysR family regulator n=1 Tax=Paraburkholderia silvatlantica TaxID=321895 RepID=A0ABR6FTU3_9BURK|nr:LysR family transcriptional regulator [Paraburkholderia silvatlantica]MBB2930844.1 DNA-binding transcriptional LysR family regulator [Paraburkholderia silvatlantica]PVY31997.1 LysR family transcriptional regulator [Paraburkholderia silvatlantica]PXW37568.1 LysR family transcriptional regulator [Paraburkholderia silvatlantica]